MTDRSGTESDSDDSCLTSSMSDSDISNASLSDNVGENDEAETHERAIAVGVLVGVWGFICLVCSAYKRRRKIDAAANAEIAVIV